jgi:hypothetical protein
MGFQLMCLLIRVADLHHFNADSDPDPAFLFNADLDPNYLFDAVPDPSRIKVMQMHDH